MILRIFILSIFLASVGCKSTTEEVVANSPVAEGSQEGIANIPIASRKTSKTDDITVPPESTPKVGTTTDHRDAYWRDRLTAQQYKVLRKQGTERAGSGVYNKLKDTGVYHCSACNAPLYQSLTKFDSGTGWPSYHTAIDGRVEREVDNSFGMNRTELLCAHCKGHLGHVFNDGPAPTGERHCINSVSLYFRPE